MDVHSERSTGLSLNPLARAQPKRTFSFYEKLEIPENIHPFELPFRALFGICSHLLPKSRKRGPTFGPRGSTNHENGFQGCQIGAPN